MQGIEVHLAQTVDGTWRVTGTPHLENGIFRLQYHALAFAQALAHSKRCNLYLHRPDGVIIRQKGASLTYPVFLE